MSNLTMKITLEQVYNRLQEYKEQYQKEIKESREETRREMRDLRVDLQKDMRDLRQDMDSKFVAMDAKFTSIDDKFTSMRSWVVSIFIGTFVSASTMVGVFINIVMIPLQ